MAHKVTALAAFTTAKSEIDDLLGQLQAMSTDHFGANPDEIHWGHVGSMNYIRDRLRQAVEFSSGNTDRTE